jgi:nucleoside phosphorylase
MLDILIAAAHPSELMGLRQILGQSLSRHVRGLRVAASTIGVGIPAAAIGATRLLRDHKPRALILLGSCGTYARAPLLTAAVPDAMQLVDAAVLGNQAAFPAPMPVQVKANRRLRAAIAKCAGPTVLRGNLATTAGITTSNALAQKLAKGSGCVVENLEGVAVGLACDAQHVAFAGIFVVTNVVGKQGRQQWASNHQAAAQRGAQILTDWIESGAPGLPPRERRRRTSPLRA